MAVNKKVSHDDDHFDFNKLEEEVRQTVLNDERYWRENDAKIRAVEQRVPTYDDFRDMVLAAHLRPLEKEDKLSNIKVFTQVWNQAVVKQKSSSENCSHSNHDNGEEKFIIPKSGQEFAQRWKRLGQSPEDRKQVLFTIGAEKLGQLFKTEISGNLLGEFLACLQDFHSEEAPRVVELLEAFGNSHRFSLSLVFFSKAEKSLCVSLFDKLSKNSDLNGSSAEAETLAALRKLYCV